LTNTLTRRSKKRSVIIIFLFLFIILSLGAYIYLNKNVSYSYEAKELAKSKNSVESLMPVEEPKFIKQGELKFLGKGTKEKIVQIDIEIADNPEEINTGLMYRHFMPDKAGMLFIYEKNQPLVFWMKNTYIPLDIIFVDEHMQIVTIKKNAQPLSEKLIPSIRDAMYVVEVSAGFCDKYGIKIGDHLSYEKIPV
jgi:uncharacterized membrane protein (UPF0127 family)